MHGLPYPLFNRQILDCLEGAMKNVQHPTTLRSRCSIGSDEPLQVIALRKYISRDSGFEVGQMAVMCPCDVDRGVWRLSWVRISIQAAAFCSLSVVSGWWTRCLVLQVR